MNGWTDRQTDGGLITIAHPEHFELKWAKKHKLYSAISDVRYREEKRAGWTGNPVESYNELCIDFIVFSSIFKIISVTSLVPVHISMLSCIFFFTSTLQHIVPFSPHQVHVIQWFALFFNNSFPKFFILVPEHGFLDKTVKFTQETSIPWYFFLHHKIASLVEPV